MSPRNLVENLVEYLPKMLSKSSHSVTFRIFYGIRSKNFSWVASKIPPELLSDISRIFVQRFLKKILPSTLLGNLPQISLVIPRGIFVKNHAWISPEYNSKNHSEILPDNLMQNLSSNSSRNFITKSLEFLQKILRFFRTFLKEFHWKFLQ